MTGEADKDLIHREFDIALTELAANILRVVAGAGRASEIPRQAAELVGVTQAYINKHGRGIASWDIEQALCEWTPDSSRELDHHYQDIAVGGMRFAASRLLGQNTQAIAARRMMLDGIREIEAARNAPPPRKPTKAEREEARQRLSSLMARIDDLKRTKRPR